MLWEIRWGYPWRHPELMRLTSSSAACISWPNQLRSSIPRSEYFCRISPESLMDWKERYPDHTVVTYINSSAEVKALSHYCCTSANAVSVVRKIPSQKILFTPDRNLGNWVKRQVPEKEI